MPALHLKRGERGSVPASRRAATWDRRICGLAPPCPHHHVHPRLTLGFFSTPKQPASSWHAHESSRRHSQHAAATQPPHRHRQCRHGVPIEQPRLRIARAGRRSSGRSRAGRLDRASLEPATAAAVALVRAVTIPLFPFSVCLFRHFRFENLPHRDREHPAGGNQSGPAAQAWGVQGGEAPLVSGRSRNRKPDKKIKSRTVRLVSQIPHYGFIHTPPARERHTSGRTHHTDTPRSSRVNVLEAQL